MVNLLGLKVSGASLALRVLLGIVLGACGFVIFYFIPANFLRLLSGVVGAIPPEAAGALSALVDPNLPAVGLAMAIAIFLCALLRGTKAYGPVTIALSIIFAAYVALFFHGGSISVAIPEALQGGDSPVGISISVSVGMTWLMALFLVPSALGVVKGILLILKKG